MTIYKIVDAVLDGVEFTRPVELADVAYVHEALSAKLPSGITLESYHRDRDVVFTVSDRGVVVCRRVKPVVEAQ